MTNWKPVARAVLLSAACLAAFPVTCNSIFAKRSAALDDDEYEYVTVSGSMIPQRIKKGSTVDTTSPVSGMSKAAFEQLRQRQQMTGKLPAGP